MERIGWAKQSARVLLIHLSALFSFCGGPLLFADLMKSELGALPAFAVAFAPIGIAVMCAFSLWPGHSFSWGRAGVAVGMAGVLVVLAMDLYACWNFAVAPANPNKGLHQFGILVGFGAAALYFYFGAKRLSR